MGTMQQEITQSKEKIKMTDLEGDCMAELPPNLPIDLISSPTSRRHSAIIPPQSPHRQLPRRPGKETLRVLSLRECARTCSRQSGSSPAKPPPAKRYWISRPHPSLIAAPRPPVLKRRRGAIVLCNDVLLGGREETRRDG
jgi:hypothetical protein